MHGPLVMAVTWTPALGLRFPAWSVVPFALMLLAIAVLPLVAGGFWERNRNKALLSVVLGAPVAVWTAALEIEALLHTASEYLAFIVLERWPGPPA